jgi:hypothetical protein
MPKIIVLEVFALIAAVATAMGADVTICDLQRSDKGRGEIVTIRGRLGFTSHGIFLLSGGCSGEARDAVILFPGASGVPAVHFALDEEALPMLRPFMRPAGGTATACAVLRGQVFYKKNLKTRREGGGPQGNGFGPRGAFGLAVVVESVKEVRACD